MLALAAVGRCVGPKPDGQLPAAAPGREVKVLAQAVVRVSARLRPFRTHDGRRRKYPWPVREAVLLVPPALAVAQQYEFLHGKGMSKQALGARGKGASPNTGYSNRRRPRTPMIIRLV